MNAKQLMIVALCVGTLCACRNNASSDSQAAAAASASAAAPLSDEALDQANVPVKEDYEDQARQEVTVENLDEQLSTLEKQIKEDT